MPPDSAFDIHASLFFIPGIMAAMSRTKARKRRARGKLDPPPKVGESPGSITPPDDALPLAIQFMRYGAESFEEGTLATAAVAFPLVGTHSVTWIDITGTADATAIRQLGDAFGFHALALEDVVHGNQRPKLEDYPSANFLVLRMPEMVNDTLEFDQMNIFVGANFVVTIQEKPGDCLDPLRERIRQNIGRVRRELADYLAYAIMDTIVDSFFPLLETYGDRLEALEVRAIEGGHSAIPTEIHSIRYDLRVVERVLWSTRELLNALQRVGHERFTPTTQVFLRDCHDHTGQLLDLVSSSQDLSRSLMELHQAALSAKANEIMKMLTIVSTVFIPLSFVAGVYGMNFDTSESGLNMPELHWRWGYPFALGLMALTAGALLWYFRRRGWLGQPRP